VGKGFLMQVVSDINKLEKDLVVSSGDIITGSVNNSWKRWIPTVNAPPAEQEASGSFLEGGEDNFFHNLKGSHLKY
jgi:hypothetical protein